MQHISGRDKKNDFMNKNENENVWERHEFTIPYLPFVVFLEIINAT